MRNDESNLFRRQLHNNEWMLKSWDIRFIKEIRMDFNWQFKQNQSQKQNINSNINNNNSIEFAPHLWVKVIKWTGITTNNKNICEFLCVVEKDNITRAVMLCRFKKNVDSKLQSKL